MSKRKGSEYSLQVKGVVGKDRKPKTYYFTLLETEKNEEVKNEDLEVLVSQKLLEVKYKYGNLVVIKYPILLDEHVHSNNKARRTKTIEVNKGEVVWRVQGYNMPAAQPVKK